jgi:hypothetical protein
MTTKDLHKDEVTKRIKQLEDDLLGIALDLEEATSLGDINELLSMQRQINKELGELRK